MLSRAELRSLGFLFFFGIILLGIPILLRSSPVGDMSYTEIRFASIIKEQHSFPRYDHLSYGGRINTHEPGYSYLLRVFGSFGFFIPILFGILNVVLLFFLLRNFPSVLFFACLFLLLTPGFLYLHTSFSPLQIGIFLFLLSGVFFVHKRFFLSAITLGLLPLFSFIFFFTAVCLGFFLLSKKGIKAIHFGSFALVSIPIFFFSAPWFLKLGFPSLAFFSLPLFSPLSRLRLFYTEIGSLSGISLFLFFLALYGLYTFASERRQRLLFLSFALLSFASAFYSLSFFTLLLLPLSFFAAFGYSHYRRSTWKVALFKYGSLLVLFTALLFSTATYFSHIQELFPTAAHQEALAFLRSQAGNETVLGPLEEG
ncbi:hypothetical protein HZB00_00225, partial [Candidatus Woesearchaeota archaeon]|nr:hypothetical protein [Candidatus Woesearchaeota archaeon]